MIMVRCLCGQIIIISEIVDQFGSSFSVIVSFVYKSSENIKNSITFDYDLIIIDCDYFVNFVDDIFLFFFNK